MWSQGLLLSGDLAGAERAAREGLDVARRIGNRWAQAFNGYALALALFQTGRLGEAIRLLRAGAESAVQGGFHGVGASSVMMLRWLLNRLGRGNADREALTALAAANHMQDDALLRRTWQALDLVIAGDAAAARGLVSDLDWPALAYSGPEKVLMALLEGTIDLAAGRPADALTVVDGLLEEMAQAGFVAMRADALVARGDALRRLGRNDEARTAYVTALDEATRQGARWPEWLALMALSETEPDPAAADYRQAAEVTRYLAGQLDPELRESFLNLPDVKRVLAAESGLAS
jgi:hypothetical protein